VPLIGFSGSPWTLACYMVEGGGSENFSRIKALAWNEPAALHQPARGRDRCGDRLSFRAARAGAQALQVFDTWGGVLPPHLYREFSLRYLTRIAQELERGQGKAHSADPVRQGQCPHLEELAASGTEGVGIDWTVSLGEARRRTGERVALQGNLDPTVLYANPDAIRSEVGAALESFGKGSGHVFNLGHGISPDVDPEHLKALIDAVHALSWPYHE
jgi:uroporphyrinogen decarboxylase